MTDEPNLNPAVVQSRESTLPPRPAIPYRTQQGTFYAKETADRCFDEWEAALTAARAQVTELTKNRDQWERNSAAENKRAGDALVKLARVEAQVEEMKQQARWRGVESELPPDGQRVLVTDGSNWSAETYPNQLARMMTPDPKEWFDCPTTHWQPYPELPTASLKQNEETGA